MQQRFHQKAIFPFVANRFAFVEVTDSHVRWQHGLNERFALPIEKIQTKLDAAPGLLGQLLGTGDVVVIDNIAGVEYRVPRVVRGRALRDFIHASQSKHVKSTTKPSEGSRRGENITSFSIQLRESQAPFCPAKLLSGVNALGAPKNDGWINTSFSQSPDAIGRLRLPGVDNGRYKSKHPILDAHGATMGFMVDGAGSLGYTTVCVYAGDCFWIAHKTSYLVWRSVSTSCVSLVDATGTFIFSNRGTKFRVVKSFGFGGDWDSEVRAFKLLDDGAYLFYLSNYGICLFDTRMREVVAKAEFPFAYQWSGFALSPKVKLLAIGCSERGDKDPIDGEYRYRNVVRIYNLETGVVVGEQALASDRQTQWTVDFSEDGRHVRMASESSTHIFELIVSR